MADGNPDLSIIVVTHNGRELALRTIASARSQTGPISCEWIVVDSGSTDDTAAAIATAWADISVTRRTNIGFAAANNIALRAARGRYVLLLNPDVEILEGSLSRLVAAMDERPAVGAASVIQVDAGGQLQSSAMHFPSPWRQLGEALLPERARPAWLQEPLPPGPSYRRELAVDWVSGAFMIVRTDVLRALGGLDERFFLYSEETDLCQRLRLAGWAVHHLPVMTVAHYGGRCDQPGLAAQLCRSKLLYAAKHHGPLARTTFRAALAVGHALRLLSARLRGRFAEARPGLAAERAALAVALGRAGRTRAFEPK